MKHTHVWRFVAGTLGIAFGVGLPVAAASHGRLPLDMPKELMVLVLISPAAVATALAAGHGRASAVVRLWWRRGQGRVPTRWWALALGLPVGVNAAALLLHAAQGGELPTLPGTPAPEQQLLPTWLLPLMFLTFSAVEEVGWRRFALPRLQARMGALAASLALGLVWAAWHLPMSLAADSAQGSINRLWYLAATLAMSVVFTWMYNSTGGSLAAVTLLHASTQASNVVLPTLPSATGTDEVHQLTVLVTVLIAAAIVARRGPGDLSVATRQTESPDDAMRDRPARTGAARSC